ncbi:MAG: hypothetical protein WAS51_13450 [Ilumatobacteraceae bacterium]|nr:MAG: hypothetical protein IPM43_12595 [Actinomycetota bacterium]
MGTSHGFTRLTAISVLLAMVLAGCGDDSNDPSDTTSSTTGEPITVQQLVERSADTPIAVRGLLIDDGGGPRFCDAILESYPPQCGEPSVELADIDVASVEGATTDQGVSWKEAAVLTVQRAPDGVFVVLSM